MGNITVKNKSFKKYNKFVETFVCYYKTGNHDEIIIKDKLEIPVKTNIHYKANHWYFRYLSEREYSSQYYFYTGVEFKDDIDVCMHTILKKNKYNLIVDSGTLNFIILTENNEVIYLVINNETNVSSSLYTHVTDDDLKKYKFYDAVNNFKNK